MYTSGVYKGENVCYSLNMPYRTVPLENNFFYHIYNRGVEKRRIFTNGRDYNRFLDSLKFYSFAENKLRFARFNPNDLFSLKKRRIEVLAYCLMPNHFHLLVRQLSDKGISKCLGQLSNSYTKYFNTKYKRVGPLFQGNFKAVLVETTEQLIHVCRYIHLNPYTAQLIEKENYYPYSSFSEYLNGYGFCKKDYVLEQFNSIDQYKTFVFDNLDYGLSLEIVKHQLIDAED